MAEEKALTEDEKRLWEYIKEYDFENHPWSTPEAAHKLNMEEDEIYNGLSELAKKLKGEIYLYYKDGAIRIATE